MARDTGENTQELRKIMDMTRMMSVVILALHYYYYFYEAFSLWGWTNEFVLRLMDNVYRTGLFADFHRSKFIALGLLAVSLLGVKGKKSEKLRYRDAFLYLLTGILLYFLSALFLYTGIAATVMAIAYMVVTSIGFIILLSGGTLLTRILKSKWNNNVFNDENETFPQEERLLENEFSINLRANYRLKNKVRKSWINIYPLRACTIAGTPGAGKTAFCVRQFIAQALAKDEPYTLFVYDFKFPDLSLIAYNHWLKNKHRYNGKPGCYFINFDDLSRSHRCNVFNVMGMIDLTDATESARTILLGLNRDWEKKSGDFFVESAINFVTAIIWYLRKYRDGQFCTLPHVIELMQVEYAKLFTILQLEEDISALINPFVKAFQSNVFPQLEGQIASAKIAMARLVSPQLYYVLSGNDFTLDVNNPAEPKLVCMGNNPQKTQTFGAVLSTYVNRMLKIINQKGKEKCMLIFEEFPTLSADLIPTITTGRSNKLACVLVIQDESQLRKDYGREKADVIMNTVGNIISGQVLGESARHLSDRIGRTLQDRESLSINMDGTSVSKSKQLEAAVPASKIAGFSSGEFAGVVADTPAQPIPQKAFHCLIEADFKAVEAEEKSYKPIPVIRQVDHAMVQRNFLQIREEITHIAESEMENITNDPSLKHLVLE